MQKIVGVRRYKDREIYYFLQNIEDLKLKEKLVVNFDDFQTVVEVVKLGLETDEAKAVELPRILRRATNADIAKYESLIKKAEDYLPTIKKTSLELGLVMKFVSAEYSLDNSKIIIVFSSEDRVDFRQFLKELALILKTRIELKQIGQRDEVKIMDGVGICGGQCCCARFLKDFEHVTVKMAKNQGLSLAPTKINGICGRLMCCLGYEASMYEELIKKMPKVGSKIVAPNGEGIVVYNDILRERVSVKRQTDSDSFVVEDFTLEEIQTGKKIEPEKKEVASQLDEFLKKNAESSALETENKKVEDGKHLAESKSQTEKTSSAEKGTQKGNDKNLANGVQKSDNKSNKNSSINENTQKQNNNSNKNQNSGMNNNQKQNNNTNRNSNNNQGGNGNNNPNKNQNKNLNNQNNSQNGEQGQNNQNSLQNRNFNNKRNNRYNNKNHRNPNFNNNKQQDTASDTKKDS